MQYATSTLLLLLAASCSLPRFVARKTVVDSTPLATMRALACTSHNGDITIEGDADATEIHVRCEMSVRGHTQAAADANIEWLDLGKVATTERLTLAGNYPRSVSGMSPTFTFVIEAPTQLAVLLESHNGNIRVIEMHGALECETHNGDIEATSRSGEATVVTHNGDITIR